MRFDFLEAFTHGVDEFPKECYEALIVIAKGGISNLKKHKLEVIAHSFTLLAWAFGKLKDNPNPVIGAAQEDDLETGVLVSLNENLRVAGDLPKQPMTGPLRNFAIKQMMAMLVSHVLSVIEDSDKVENYVEDFLEWLNNHLNK